MANIDTIEGIGSSYANTLQEAGIKSVDKLLEAACEKKSRQALAARTGISVMGVPVPNAWLGNINNVDLVAQFGGDGGVWQGLVAGIASLQVADGELVLELEE